MEDQGELEQDKPEDESAAADGKTSTRLEGRLWQSVKRMTVGGGSLLVLTAPLRAVGYVSETAVCRLAAAVMLLFALLYAGRTEVHLENRYWQWHPTSEPTTKHPRKGSKVLHRLLCIATALNFFIAEAFGVSGMFFLRHPDNAAEFLVAASLALLILLNNLLISWLIQVLDLKRGSETVKRCWFTKIVRGAADRIPVGFVKKLDDLWDKKTAENALSKLVLWTVGALCIVALANTPAVAPTAWRIVSSRDGDKSGDAKSGEEPEKATKPKKPGKAESGGTSKPKSNTPSGSAPAGVAPSPSATPSYTGVCASDQIPGRGAPEPQRSLLFKQWLGDGGLGAILAGCSNKAHRVGQTDVYYSAGTCGDEVRSLAVADHDDAAILLWAPAQYALDSGLHGSLLGATAHVAAGSGDLYGVDTTDGTSVFARRSLSDGNAVGAENARSCNDIKPDPVPFIRVPPALSRLWRDEVVAEQRWLWPTSGDGHQFTFHSLDPADTDRITADCSSDTNCAMLARGVSKRATGPGGIDIQELLRWAPPAAKR